MKNNRVVIWLWLPLALACLSAGCATKQPLVGAWRDPQFSVTRSNKIALTEQVNPDPQNVAFGQLLTNELKQEGFTLVSSDQADFLLAYALEEDLKEQQTVRHYDYRYTQDPMSAPGSIPSYPGARGTMSALQVQSAPGSISSYPGARDTMSALQVQPVERDSTYRFFSQNILLYLYTNPKTQAGNFKMVWQGSIEGGSSTSASHQQLLLQTLLRYFGKSQNGRVNLSP